MKKILDFGFTIYDCLLAHTRNGKSITNRVFTVITILLVSISALQAQQEKYVKVNTDFKSNGIVLFAGEIYALDKQDNKDWKYFTVNGKECRAKNDVDVLPNKADDKTGIKDTIVKKIKDTDTDSIRIHIHPIGRDTVWIANDTFKIHPITDSVTVIASGSVDSIFRLIIPNEVTIWYNKSELKEYAKPEQSITPGGNTGGAKETKGFLQRLNTNVPGGIYAVAGLILLLLIAGGVWYFFFRKRPDEVVFKGRSLTKFAKKYGGIDKLHELNPDIIPSEAEWKSLKEIPKNNKIEELQKKPVRVREVQNILPKPEVVPSETNKEEEPKVVSPSSPETDLSAQLRKMEKTIIDEINKIKSAESKAEKERLIQEKEKFETLVKEKETQLEQLNSAHEELNSKYTPIAKAIWVGYLQNYAASIYAYLRQCGEVERKADSLYDKTVATDQYKASIIACLLQRFRSSVCDIPVGDWQQIVKDIKDTGITVNIQVIRAVSQPPDTLEKMREFQKTVFREVIVRYSSSVLVLAESFRNLARFGIDGGETVQEFKKYADNIVRKAKTLDIEIKYVPLFEKYDNYSAKIESVNRKRSFPYSEIGNLQRDDIAEIVSYGVKTEFEDTKTQIIIE